MKKLLIEKIENFHYYLKDKQKKYVLLIEFYDLEEEPKEGDYVYLNEEILENENIMYSFGPLDSKYGRKITEEKDKDLFILNKNGKNVYLKRYYG
ncbi:MAG: hypothetical protein J6K21_03740 [Bacilli bacterium]|nr:hypothetical protein [Bacilli bacterium]